MPQLKQLSREKKDVDYIDFKTGVKHYIPNNDPLSQHLSCFNNDDDKTLKSFVIGNIPIEVVCTCCGELAISPQKLACCGTIICHQCACKARNVCPIEHCLNAICGMEYCDECRNIDDMIDNLSIHCIDGCGWYGAINAFPAHRENYCFLANVEDGNSIDGSVVRYNRCEVNDSIVKIAERVRQLQLDELFDYVNHRATTKFQEQMQKLHEMTTKLLESSITTAREMDEQRQKERKAANDVIQRDARPFEALSNSVTTKTSGGGNHQTFDNASWAKIHDMTMSYAGSLFGDSLEKWHCVDIGAGILIGVLSGSVASSKMIWTGVEIDANRLRLGAEICKLFETKWRKQSSSTRELHIAFLQADCVQPLNLRG